MQEDNPQLPPVPNEHDKIGEEFGGTDFKSTARNERLFNYMLITLVIVVVGAIGFQLLKYGPGTVYAKRDKEARLALRAQQEADNLLKVEAEERRAYRQLSATADSLAAANNFEAAAFQLRNAVEIFPDSLNARIRLLEIYATNCAINERQCASADKVRERLLQRPDVQNNADLLKRVNGETD